MRRDRFGLWVALTALVVGAASFVVALQVLDDGQPDPAPGRSTSDTSTPSTTAADPVASTTTITSTTTTPGALATPAWIAIVASEKSRPKAESAAAEVAAQGHPAGVLRSDDYESLAGGLWVAYSGPFATSAKARAAVDSLDGDGIKGAYVRCVGTTAQCRGDAASNGD